MNKKKSLSEKLQHLTYMQVSLTLFAFAAVMLILSLVLAFVMPGEVGWVAGTAGIMAGLLSLAGVIVTLYGHFAVGMEGKAKWTLGVILNGVVFAVSLGLYILGLAA